MFQSIISCIFLLISIFYHTYRINHGAIKELHTYLPFFAILLIFLNSAIILLLSYWDGFVFFLIFGEMFLFFLWILVIAFKKNKIQNYVLSVIVFIFTAVSTIAQTFLFYYSTERPIELEKSSQIN